MSETIGKEGIEIEDISWISSVGKFFEICRLLFHSIERFGGNAFHVDQILRRPLYAEEFASVLMGSAEIKPLDPVTIITETGLSEAVKINAVGRLKNDGQKLSLIKWENSLELTIALVSSVEEKKKIYNWVAKMSVNELHSWATACYKNEQRLPAFREMLHAIDDNDLYGIYKKCISKATQHAYHTASYVVSAMENQKMLKQIVIAAIGDEIVKAAVGKITDGDLLEYLYVEYRKPNPEVRKNSITSAISTRIRQLQNPSSEEGKK